jgi:hypothetical protein
VFRKTRSAHRQGELLTSWNLVAAEVAVLVNVVDVGAHGLGDLPDLGEDLLAMSKDDEDILVDRLVVGRIDQRLGNLRLVHVQVATEGSPQDALEGGDTVPGMTPATKPMFIPEKDRSTSASIDVCCSTSEQQGCVVVVGRLRESPRRCRAHGQRSYRPHAGPIATRSGRPHAS